MNRALSLNSPDNLVQTDACRAQIYRCFLEVKKNLISLSKYVQPVKVSITNNKQRESHTFILDDKYLLQDIYSVLFVSILFKLTFLESVKYINKTCFSIFLFLVGLSKKIIIIVYILLYMRVHRHEFIQFVYFEFFILFLFKRPHNMYTAKLLKFLFTALSKYSSISVRMRVSVCKYI